MFRFIIPTIGIRIKIIFIGFMAIKFGFLMIFDCSTLDIDLSSKLMFNRRIEEEKPRYRCCFEVFRVLFLKNTKNSGGFREIAVVFR